MQNKEEIYQKITAVLENLFEIDPQKVTLESHLYTDFDIDSIDAVDLMVELKNITGKKIMPDDFKSVRTVQDVVDAVAKLLDEG